MRDLISRQAAIDAVNTALFPKINTAKDVEKALKQLPSAERRGQWEDIEHAPNGLLYVTCSVCGKRQTVEFTSYCGNCGAKMERAEE